MCYIFYTYFLIKYRWNHTDEITSVFSDISAWIARAFNTGWCIAQYLFNGILNAFYFEIHLLTKTSAQFKIWLCLFYLMKWFCYIFYISLSSIDEIIPMRLFHIFHTFICITSAQFKIWFCTFFYLFFSILVVVLLHFLYFLIV